MKKTAIVLIIIALLDVSLCLGVSYYFLQLGMGRYISQSQHNGKIVAFNSLFVQKVLKARGAVSPEDRLRLENAVYSTNDEQIVQLWNDFLASQTEREAQGRVLTLLTMFYSKIIY